MAMTALALTISVPDAHESDVGRPRSDAHPVRKVDDRGMVCMGQVLHVCFPVPIPGERGGVVPFGRYELAVPHQDELPRATPDEVVLANLDNGARVALSVQELTAVVRDHDVEIV